MLTINEIETIVQAFCNHDIQDTDLNRIILNHLLKQTNLETIEEVKKILSLYKDTKSRWLKAGLENVLLYGKFPVTIEEVNTPIMPRVPMQPIVWPTSVPPVSVPPVKFEPYCNYNDSKSENLTKVK